jgi:hypothetical protein
LGKLADSERGKRLRRAKEPRQIGLANKMILGTSTAQTVMGERSPKRGINPAWQRTLGMELNTRKQLQREILHELKTRIPRGPAGSVQTQFRHQFYFYRARGLPFELSVLVAAARIREHEPDFVPTILDLRTSTQGALGPEALAADNSTVDGDAPPASG